MFSDRFKYIIFLGFVAVMLLMVAVVVVGNQQMGAINRSMETIVNEYNVKTGYISTMSTTVRERSMRLLQMVSTRDPFAREEQYMYFNQLATKFVITRVSMKDLGLDDEESRFLSEQQQYAVKSSELQDAVVQLLYDDDVVSATRLLLDEAIPAQHHVLEQLTHMLEYQQMSARKALDEANRSYERTQVQVGFLMLGALIISLSIIVHVIRGAARFNKALLARTALSAIDEAIILVDAEGCINFMNLQAEQLAGWLSAEVEGRDFLDALKVSNKNGKQNGSAHLQSVFLRRRELTKVSNILLQGRSGEQCNTDFSVTPVFDENGERAGSVLVFRKAGTEVA